MERIGRICGGWGGGYVEDGEEDMWRMGTGEMCVVIVT